MIQLGWGVGEIVDGWLIQLADEGRDCDSIGVGCR